MFLNGINQQLLNHFNSLTILCFQIHHIDFDDENNVINKNIYLHPEGEIWNITASTIDKDLMTTCYNKSKNILYVHAMQSAQF